MKSPKPRNQAQRKVDYKNFDAIIYEQKLSAEIISRNYELVYYVAQNVGIIGILAYPKIFNDIFCYFKSQPPKLHVLTIIKIWI